MARESREVWAKRVAAWKSSGLTASKFAQKHRLVEGSLSWWSWKLGTERKKAAPVSPLTFVEMTTSTRSEAIELVVGAIQIRVPADFDENALGKVLDVVERRR